MNLTIRHVNRGLALAAMAMGCASILLADADKSPIYFLLAYRGRRAGPVRQEQSRNGVME